MWSKKVRSKRSKRSRPSRRPKVSKQLKTYVKKALVRGEEKKITVVQQDAVSIPSGVFSTTGIDLLQHMQRGTSESVTGNTYTQDMLGLQVRLKNLVISGNIMTSNSSIGSSMIRLLLVQDNQASNNTALQLFSSTTGYDNLIFQVPHVTSPINKFKRFSVLSQKTIYLDPDIQAYKRFSMIVNLKDMLLKYYPTTTTFYELNKKLYLFYIAYDNNGGLNHTTLQFVSNITFVDA